MFKMKICIGAVEDKNLSLLRKCLKEVYRFKLLQPRYILIVSTCDGKCLKKDKTWREDRKKKLYLLKLCACDKR